MKRLLVILVVIALLIGAAVYFFMPRGAADGARLLPADTVLYFTLPDTQRTIQRWPKTALAQIGAEPAVMDFFNKPAGTLAQGGGLEAADLLFRVKPGRLFLAVTAVRQNGAQVVLGFQFFGGRKDVDAAMDRLYREVGKKMPNATTATADYKGDAVTAFSTGSPILFSASHGSWGFISNHEPSLQQALDRAAGRNNTASLASSDEFKNVTGRLARDPDFLWYGKIQPLLDMLLEAGAQQQAEVNQKQLEQMKKMKALGGTLLFDGVDQKEVSFILYPDAPKLDPINRSPMALTTPETSFFFDTSMDTRTIATDEYFQSLPPGAQAFLTDAKIDLKQIPEVVGNDLGLLMSWPPSVMIPSTLLAIEIKDRARALSLLQSLFAGFGIPAVASESGGATLLQLPSVNFQLIDPTFAVTDKFVLASLTSTELNRALAMQPGAPTLESGAAFKSVLGAYKADSQAFGYVDARALFERAYNWLRPMALLASAFSPSENQLFDLNKLPETETVSKHLTPILYTNRQLSDGMLIESSGPVTLSQAVALIAIGAGAGYASQMMDMH